mgnify:CR=1 FL=1
MPYFKAPDNSMHYLTDGDIANGWGDSLPPGSVMVTDYEASVIRSEQPAPAIAQVTMRQARLALLDAGKLDLVTEVISQLPEPARTKARIEWEFAQDVRKDWPLIQVLAPSIGLDAAALTAIFNRAATL